MLGDDQAQRMAALLRQPQAQLNAPQSAFGQMQDANPMIMQLMNQSMKPGQNGNAMQFDPKAIMSMFGEG